MEVVIRVGVILDVSFGDFLNDLGGIIRDGDCGFIVRIIYLYYVNWRLIV